MNVSTLSYTEKCALARDPDIDVTQLIQLAKDADSDLLCYVSEHPNCPEILLEKLAHNREFVVRSSVARNRNTPAHLLVTFASDKDWDVRRAAAENANLPIDMLRQLAKDNSDDVRCGVAAVHPNCPGDIMLTLSTDHCWAVRMTVAANPICSERVLLSMSNDNHKNVRAMAAGNPNCPTLSLIRLANDVDSETRSNAQKTLCSKTRYFWIKAVDDGLSLSSVLENCFMYANNRFVNTAVGDALLAAGLSNVYQLIQSAELTIQVKKSADITKNPDPLPLIGVPHVRNLRM